MTQYMLSVQHTGAYPAMDSPEAQEMFAATGAFTDKLQASGQWVFVGGLQGVDTATRIDARGGDAVVTDGAYVESKEHLAGFWVIEAADLDEAIALAAEASKACNDPIEVRPFHSV
ncbi:YciI family protein [Aeromicrobium sp. Leaf350]|uniref:YciI family protein n=1 Tax=Aeromicrobium sp. Leaf350 TaxID=2876565 RepID=UPI00210418E5|nr:YciI family protein [Aeromicrobium sp. Leaf350]